MNISQKQAILTEIETIQGFDFDQMIISQSPENTELQSVMFGKYNALEFKTLLHKAMQQLKSELEKGFGLWLPNQETFYNDFGQITLSSDIVNLRTYVANIHNSNDAAEILDRIIYYQIRQGFWDRSSIKIHNIDSESLSSAQQQIKLIYKNLSANIEKFNELQSQYEMKLEEVNTFLTAKRTEMVEVAGLLAEANTSNTRITELVSSTTNKDTEITGVLKNVADKLTTVTENIITYQTSFSSIEIDAATLKQQLEETLITAKQDLEKAEQAVEFVDGKREEIVRLTGMAADGSLGSKFDQRQITLSDGLSFWKWGVPLVTFLSVLWVIAVFTWLPTHTNNEWINLLVNLLKTTPAFILMGFVFSQYGKERNLQEEYAFKSAVAMTLTAYSGMLEKGDDAVNKTRQEMLLKSIQQVYLQPRIHPEKPDRIYSANGKHLKDAIQTLSEAVKNIKS